MTKETAVKLMGEYAQVFREAGEQDTTLTEIDTRWPEDGSEKKAMRWLGFMQGALYTKGLFTLDDVKEHSRNGCVG